MVNPSNMKPGATVQPTSVQAPRLVAVCQVPDPATGQPHVLLGMAAPFTVV